MEETVINGDLIFFLIKKKNNTLYIESYKLDVKYWVSPYSIPFFQNILEATEGSSTMINVLVVI